MPLPTRRPTLARLHPRRWDAKVFLLGGATILVAYLVLVPLVFLIYGSFFPPAFGGLPGSGEFTLKNYTDIYANTRIHALFLNSLYYALGSAALSVGTALAIAWLVERTNMPGRQLFYTLAIGPLIIPGILFTIAWMLLLSPSAGMINGALIQWLGLESAPFDIYSMAGMIWVEGLHSSPVAFLLIAAALRATDPALEEAAKMSGAGGLTTFFQVTVKLIRPALLSSFLIMFIHGLEAFEVPSLVGLPAKVHVLITRIYLAMRGYPPDFGLAGSLSVVSLILAGLGVYWYTRLANQGDRFSTITGKGFRPATIDLGPWRWPAAALLVAYLSLVFFLPLLALLWASLSPYFAVPSWEMLPQLSLDNYRWVLEFPTLKRAMVNSAVLAVGGAVIIMLLTAAIAWVVVRTRIRGRWALDTLVSMPLAFPSLVLGVALIWLYLALPIQLYGTIWILLIAYITKFMPVGMRYTSAAVVQVHRELEEAAAVCGATWTTMFRRILLPLLTPGLAAGAIFVFIVAFRELGTSILLFASGTEVFSIVMFDMWENGQSVEVAALGVLVTLGFLVLAYLAQALGRRYGIGPGH